MFKRKLIALDYPKPTEDFSDDASFRKMIVWLEDQKIRHYKIEDRTELRDTESPNWESAAQKYLADIFSPYPISERPSLLDWLMGFAIGLEYGDNAEKYRKAPTVAAKKDGSTGTILDNVDFNSADFKAGVASLAKLLNIPPHSDHLVVLRAVNILITERLTKEAIERSQKDTSSAGAPRLPLDKVDLGFEISDLVVQEAAKVLRLLHIKELRDLQSLANEAIVAVQTITANPKTDSKLGKVGQS